MKIKINEEKIKIIKQTDESYPKKLLNIYNKPQTIYVLGNERLLQDENTINIAIIGCRDCSKYGAAQAYKFGQELASKGVCIVSGMARGIDTYSHKGVIAVHGKTIAVLGCGLDIIYPEENLNLYKEILKTGGAIVTEYPLGTKPEKYNFPIRNRIISGLSDGVLVVEAKKRSGTMITVDYALEQGKDVYAIPGNITSINSYGTNELIKEGAIPVTSIEDFNI